MEEPNNIKEIIMENLELNTGLNSSSGLKILKLIRIPNDVTNKVVLNRMKLKHVRSL